VARTVYSTRLFQAVGFSSSVIIGPVPTNEVWVLRDLDSYGNMSPFQTARLYLRGPLGQTIAFLDWPSNTESWQGWRGRQVIAGGETFTVTVLGGGPLDATLSGYVLLNG
jgi:hypothetical protein